MKHARDLFLLASIAYLQGKYEDSAILYSHAMASDDVENFLDILNEENTVTAKTLNSVSRSIDYKLEDAAARFSASLSSLSEDEVDEEFGVESSYGDDDEDFDVEGLDADPSMPGQPILPSSLSTILIESPTTPPILETNYRKLSDIPESTVDENLTTEEELVRALRARGLDLDNVKGSLDKTTEKPKLVLSSGLRTPVKLR